MLFDVQKFNPAVCEVLSGAQRKQPQPTAQAYSAYTDTGHKRTHTLLRFDRSNVIVESPALRLPALQRSHPSSSTRCTRHKTNWNS